MANRRFIDFPIATTVGDNDIVLIWQDGANKQTTKATILSGLPENLEDLNDVVISGLTNGQILRYDSVTGKWENTDQGNLDLNDLNDVSIVSPSNGQVLVYNSSTSKWENSSGGFVPYVGAVTTVDLGAQGLRAGYVRFDTSVASVPQEQGLMFWDADDETVDIILNGYTMKIGEDLFYPVKNQTGSTIAKGTAVRFNGTVGNSGRLLIAPFIANGSVPSNRFMGVTAEEILNGEDGKVLYFGRIRGINTNAFNEGDILYASTTVAGGFQTAIPVAPNNIVLVAAVVTKSINQGTIFVRPTLASNLNTDEAVKITSVANLDLLQYQSGTGLWENKTLAQILGGTASQFVKGNGSLDSTSYQPLLTNPVTGTGAAGRVAYWNGSGTITSDSLFQWNDFSKRLGIGRTPTVSLDVEGAGFFSSSVTASSIIKSGGTSSQYLMADGSVSTLTNPVTGTGTTNYLPKFTGSTTIGNSNLINDASGNLGLGVTPSAWDAVNTRALQLDGGSVYMYGGDRVFLGQNIFFGSLGDTYVKSAPATTYRQFNGTHAWYNAPSGTAGNAISFTQAMTLTSGGNLLVGTTTDNGARLQVIGFSRFDRGTLQFTLNPSYAGGNVYSQLQSTGALALATGGDNNRLYIDTSGNVGIGTSSPSAPLHLVTPTGVNFQNAIRFEKAGGYGEVNLENYYTTGSNYGFGIDVAGTTMMVVNNLGNVGIGTSSPLSGVSGGGLQVTNSTAAYVRVNATGFTGIDLIQGSDGTGYLYLRDNNDIRFGTNNTERMRITSGGNVLIGTTTDNGARLQVSGTSFFSSDLLIGTTSNSPSSNVGIKTYADGRIYCVSSSSANTSESYSMYSTGAANYRFYVGWGGTIYATSTSISGISDISLKTNIRDLDKGLQDILQLKPRRFDWKNGDGKDNIGFVAQEIESIFPELISEYKYNQFETKKSLKMGDLIPSLVKAIQELKQEIDTLKN